MSRRRSGLAYSKAANVAEDLPQLTGMLVILDRHPDVLSGQHEIRRWEYAMALRTIHKWQDLTRPPTTYSPLMIGDVGGAGSFFWQVLAGLTATPVVLIDAALPADYSPQGHARVACVRASIEEYAAGWDQAQHGAFDVLTAISVIEHVVQVKHFFRACHRLLRPGGLLFFTTDYWDAEGEDTAHFHWMRQRIYNAGLIRKLLVDLREVGFQSFGEADWSYHGPQLYDYSVCSVAMVKK